MAEPQHTRRLHVDRLAGPPTGLVARLPWIGGIVGGLGLAGSVALYGSDPRQFYFSWLVAFLFFLSIALGGLFFVLVHFATKSGWGVVVRRLAENLAGTLPLLALLSLPLFLGMHELFHWSEPEVVQHDRLLQGKQPYLNPAFFFARAAVYFACWVGLAWWYRGRSTRQDRVGDPELTRGMIVVSGPALMVFAVTLTFAAFDWLMSLDPHWYSTIFGVYYFSGCLVGVFAVMAVLAVVLRRAGPLREAISVEHLHDLGKLLFAFTVFWAYIAFSQFFLIWYANIPEETLWYLHRLEGGWRGLTVFLAVGHFAAPFLFLMSRTVKRRAGTLVAGAVWMLFMHLVDIYWLVMPTLHGHDVHLSPLDLTTFCAVGGLFLAGLGWLMRHDALVPLRDPRLVESLSFHNF